MSRAFTHVRRSLQQWRFYKLVTMIVLFLVALALVVGVVVILYRVLPPLTTPANALEVLRAIVDVAGVLLGFSGIMFANTLMTIGQEISEIRRDLVKNGIQTGPLDALRKYRRMLVILLLFTYGWLIVSIVCSLVMMTYVTEMPTSPGTYSLVSAPWALFLPLYLLVAGVLTMAASLMQEPP